ncbi:MAG TPA: cbb3-type cytochrome c oxidase subunit I [Vicinamibacterales bacterium]|nr:cbb3-type cytochrome c oxidase subunit I [Vicinamibacterales bacterium]
MPIAEMHLTDHKTVGLQYFATAIAFLLVGFLLMLVLRWQLAWPAAPMPGIVAALVGGANAPGGYMAPEFYNQLVAMHGTIMIFLAVVPLLTGAFGNYLVPLQIGARDMAYPRLNATSYWTYLVAGVVMVASFFVEGGAADSGWTAYPPLAILATRGQDFWLVGIFLLGVSAMLNSINVIATVIQLRAPGLRFMQLPFFVWTQLIAALLLLAFPSLQAAGLLQLMDRLAGTSFFLPSGLVVNGVPMTGVSGDGNALLWQHLFWFLGHPEVYVLILPAIGIVSEIIVRQTGRPLWGYRAMVWSLLFLGVISTIVWAHHMFLTGMGTTLGAFFQVTTMIVSIPSVVLVTSLMLSLWGSSIQFTTPMLFALAFLPMFGIGRLTGLPLGLAASDVILHDTWYVVGHFHFLVAPGTLFAIFGGIYYWFPKVTGRALNHTLGMVHFWGSLATMTAIFLPMFTLGLRGVNRRLYDAGMSYAHAQGTLGVQEHMTWAAVALGMFQLPFLVNIVWSLRRDTPVDDAYRFDRPRVTGPVPWTDEPRPDSRTTNVRLGMWLFLSSEAMFFGSLFSACVLLRTGAATWADPGDWLPAPALVVMTALLLVTSGVTRRLIWVSTGAGVMFLVMKGLELSRMLDAGLHPAVNLTIACWFVLTGAHWLHVAGGVCANVWVARSATRLGAAHVAERFHAVRLYWMFVDVVWVAILVSFLI